MIQYLTPYKTDKLKAIWWLLKITYGVVWLVAGADKFFNLVTYWGKYLNPMWIEMTGLAPLHILYAAAIFEIIAGLLVLTAFTRLGAYLIVAGLGIVMINLFLLGGYYDIVVRDFVIAVGALTLAQLTEILHDQRKE